MAARTGVRGGGIIARGVAFVALRRCVRARQRVKTVVVIHRCPRRLAVATRTIGAEMRRRVVRIRRLCEVIRVTTRAGVGCIRVIALVAVVAAHRRVRPHDRVNAVVIKCRRRPAAFTVALRAIRRELRQSVIRVRRRVVVGRVAARTGVRGGGIIARGMTFVALRRRVRARQRVKTVVVVHRCPRRLGMTTGTIRAEMRCRVVRIGGLCEIIRVTTRAGIGRIRVIALVTFVATHCGMRSI